MKKSKKIKKLQEENRELKLDISLLKWVVKHNEELLNVVMNSKPYV